MQTHHDTVLINNEQGTFNAVTHLYELGHRHIGLISTEDDRAGCNNFRMRTEAFKKSICYYNLEYADHSRCNVVSTLEGSYQGMKEYLALGNDLPTAFFAENDILAVGAIRALKEAGYRVPDDVSIIGFDDMSFCDISEPPLTTIAVPKEQYGSLAASLLIDKINNTSIGTVKIEIGTYLVERKSTAAIVS